MMENTPRSCLIVDDDLLIQKYLSVLVEACGFRVCGAAVEGREAIAKAIEHRPEYVLMDMQLAGDMDGVDTALAMYEHVRPRVIFISASNDSETRARINQDHPYAFLPKPIAMGELRNLLLSRPAGEPPRL